eukprot:TRINITY_DN2514_c0_g1_i4.p1 TRINITY_DN2514_c0_g1~~TRINITY_DN2514_c0_g1_i4.p1  ORF type:complete len:233 (-),score=32.37 TRINITY_DN2514_c0_g1_i4:78-776(-)
MTTPQAASSLVCSGSGRLLRFELELSSANADPWQAECPCHHVLPGAKHRRRMPLSLTWAPGTDVTTVGGSKRDDQDQQKPPTMAAPAGVLLPVGTRARVKTYHRFPFRAGFYSGKLVCVAAAAAVAPHEEEVYRLQGPGAATNAFGKRVHSRGHIKVKLRSPAGAVVAEFIGSWENQHLAPAAITFPVDVFPVMGTVVGAVHATRLRVLLRVASSPHGPALDNLLPRVRVFN